MPANRPTTIIRDAKAMGAFYTEAKAIGAASAENKDTEHRLKLNKALRVGLGSIVEPAGTLALETRLIEAARDNPVEPAGVATPEEARNNRRAEIMAPMLLESLSRNGLHIGHVRRPTDVQLTECGFVSTAERPRTAEELEEEFMDHFTRQFVPHIVGYYLPAAVTVTLSKKQKEDIQFVLTDLTEYHPQTVEELKVFLDAECEQLFEMEGAFTTRVPNTPRPKAPAGSRRAELEEVLGLSRELLQKRVDYMRMWVTDRPTLLVDTWRPANMMMVYVKSIGDYNPTLTFDSRGDNPNGASVAGVQLSDLRNPPTADDPERKFKIELAAAIDELPIPTPTATRAAQIAPLNDPNTGEPKLRKAIWDNRKKVFEGFIRLLPSDVQIAYLEHQGMAAFTAGASARTIERSIEYLQKLAVEYTAIPANTRNAEQQNTLDLINGLLVLAQAIWEENEVLKTVRGNHDIDTPPDDVEAQDPRFFTPASVPPAPPVPRSTVRDNRINAEANLAKIVEAQNARLEEKEFNYGSNKTAVEGQKTSKVEYDWELARITRLVGKKHATVVAVPTAAQNAANLASNAVAGVWNVLTGTTEDIANNLSNVANIATGSNAADIQTKNTANTNLAAALNAVPGTTPVLAIPHAYAEKEDRSFVAIRVDFKNKTGDKGNKGNITLGKRFMYGVEGKQLTAAQGSTKLQHIVMFDKADYELAQGAPACVPSTLTVAVQRAAQGKDIGDGRFTKILNDATNPRSPLNPNNSTNAPLRTPKTPAGPNQQWRYVYEVDPNTPYGILYWALVDTTTGAVTEQEKVNVYELDANGKVAKDAQGEPTLTQEGALLTEVYTEILTTGLSVYHKCSLEAKDQDTYKSLYRNKTTDNDFEVRPILAKEPDFKKATAQASSSTSTQSALTKTWAEFGKKLKVLPSGAVVTPIKKGIRQQAHEAWQGIKAWRPFK